MKLLDLFLALGVVPIVHITCTQVTGGGGQLSAVRALDESTCRNGISGVEGENSAGEVACCSITCLNDDGEPECGGKGCGWRDGRQADECCIGTINEEGTDCETSNEAPCFIIAPDAEDDDATDPDGDDNTLSVDDDDFQVSPEETCTGGIQGVEFDTNRGSAICCDYRCGNTCGDPSRCFLAFDEFGACCVDNILSARYANITESCDNKGEAPCTIHLAEDYDNGVTQSTGGTGDNDANEQSNVSMASSTCCFSGIASFFSLSVVMYAIWYGPV